MFVVQVRFVNIVSILLALIKNVHDYFTLEDRLADCPCLALSLLR